MDDMALTNAERAFRREMAAYGLKWCSGCAAFLPIGLFGKDNRRADGTDSRCLGCCAKRVARYKAANRDKVRDGKARYYRANANKVRESNAQHYRDNADKERDRAARYARANPDKNRAKKRRRRARLAAVESRPYNEAEIYAAYGYACVFCGAEATAIEHFVPIALGGPDIPENLVIACTSCNSSKGAKSPLAWLREARGITFGAVRVAN